MSRSAAYVATIRGRNLRVYVEQGTEPPLVRTVTWQDKDEENTHE